jgi:hypothetical protein
MAPVDVKEAIRAADLLPRQLVTALLEDLERIELGYQRTEVLLENGPVPSARS